MTGPESRLSSGRDMGRSRIRRRSPSGSAPRSRPPRVEAAVDGHRPLPAEDQRAGLSFAIARATSENRAVWSRPVRLTSWTAAPRSYALTRRGGPTMDEPR